jgi:GNAT superfamily N-acetyltransferase
MALQNSTELSQLTDSAAQSLVEELLSPREEPQPDEPQEEVQPDESQQEREPEVVEDVDESDVEEEDEQDEPQPPRTLRVKVNGEELEVTEEEAARGYSRTQDYTRKTQELAERRKAFEQNEQAVLQERQRYAEVLERLEQMVAPADAQEPDWATLREELDPAEYNRAVADYQLEKIRAKELREERERVAAVQQRDAMLQRARIAEQEYTRLLETVPEWKDQAVAKKDMEAIVGYAESIGFTQNDVAEVLDHRLMRVLRDAARFNTLQKAPKAQSAAKPTPGVTKAPMAQVKPLAAGSSASVRKPVTEITRAKQRLAKTGSDKDAIRLVEQLI